MPKIAGFPLWHCKAEVLQMVVDTESLYLHTIQHALGCLVVHFSQLMINTLVVDVQ